MPYDKNEKDFIQFINLIGKGEHVLDIGANIGVMTYYFAKKLPESTVHSFEPIPENLKTLKKIVEKYNLSNVKIYPYALGNKNEDIEMIMPEFNKVFLHGLSYVKKTNCKNSGCLYNVEMKRLDDIEELKNIKIIAIKIDVEEYEYNVLKGAEELIQKNRPLIYCELWESENRKKSLNFISKLNYKVFINKKKILKEYKHQYGFQNFFFIPAERCSFLTRFIHTKTKRLV